MGDLKKPALGPQRLTALMAGVAMASSCVASFDPVGSAYAQSVSVSRQERRACYADAPGEVARAFANAEQQALKCKAAGDSENSRDRAANAYLNAGRAYLAWVDQLRANPADTRIPYALGLAIESFESALSSPSEARTLEARLGLAAAFRMRGSFDEANRVVDQILRVQPGNAAALLERAYVVLERDKDGGRRTALEYLDVFSGLTPEDARERALYVEGRKKLFEVAMSLGRSAQTDPTTRDNPQIAIEYFKKAARTAEYGLQVAPPEEAARANVQLGNAELRLAGLSDPAMRGDFYCEPDKKMVASLEPALQAFNRAIVQAPSAEAYFGQGCALLVSDRAPASVASFESAVRAAPDRATYQLTLARALSAANRWSEAEPIYERAIQLNSGSAAARSRIHVEIAAARSQRGEYTEALQNLNQAVALDPSNRAANLARGKLHFNNLQNVAKAQTDFAEATNSSDPEMQAEAWYYLSRIEVRSGGSGRRAVETADLAVRASKDASKDSDYRGQACLARIYNRPVREEAATMCLDQRRLPTSLLNEGMYHLARTYTTIGGDQSRSWEAAERAFSQGLSLLGEPTPTEMEETQALRANLQVGRGISMFCAGFQTTGDQIIAGAGARRGDGERFFQQYGFADCARRR